MTLPVFLVRRQDHLRALAALEIDVESSIFPAIARCPVCHQNTLHLFDDILTDGLWLYCTACQTHGNIITFGSTIWKTKIADTIGKFVDFGLVNSAVATQGAIDYELAADKIAGADAFWAQTSAQLWSHDDDITACRLREMGVNAETKAGENLVGVAYAHQIAELCESLNRKKWVPLRGRNPSIVFPYYDLPGRLSGFLLYQYGDEFNEKKTFLSVAHKPENADAGYFLLNSLLQPSPEIFRGKQFIVSDPQWALAAQCAYLTSGIHFGPVIASCGNGNAKSIGRCWGAMPPAVRFFHADTITPETVSQACAARGYVCPVLLSNKTTERKRHTFFLQKLHQIHSAAVSWQTGLETALRGLSDIGAYNFITKLNVPHEKIQTFFERRPDKFSDEFCSRVLANLRYRPVSLSRVFGKSNIVERDGQWWTATGNLVCNAQIVITKITQFDNGEKTYAGQILMPVGSLSFNVPAVQIEKRGLLAFAEKYAATHGYLLTFNRQWNNRSLLAALHLHPPKVEVVSSQIGWDETANIFRLGTYAIDNSGQIELTQLPASRLLVHFAEPGIVAPEALQQFLTRQPQNDFVWAVIAALFANIIAPVVRKDPRATAITEPAFSIARKIGAAIGCRYTQTDNLNRNGVQTFVSKQTDLHTWPFFIANSFDANLLSSTVNRHYNTHIVAATTKMTAAISVGYGWQTISDNDLPPITANFSCFCQILPMYVQHCLRNRMRISVPNSDFAENILTDLHDWVKNLCGQTFNINRTRQRILLPAEADTALFKELGAAVAAKKIDVIPRPRRPDQPDNYILCRKQTWWINKKAIDGLCRRSKNVVPNWLQIVDLLASRGAFVEEEFVHKMPGIVITKNWGDQFLTTGATSAQKEVG